LLGLLIVWSSGGNDREHYRLALADEVDDIIASRGKWSGSRSGIGPLHLHVLPGLVCCRIHRRDRMVGRRLVTGRRVHRGVGRRRIRDLHVAAENISTA